MFAAFAIFQCTQHPPIVPGEILIKTFSSRWWKVAIGKNFLECFHKMMIVGDACFMKINLGKHEIARKNQPFRCVQSAFGYTEGGATSIHSRNRLDRLYKTSPIETAIIDSCMMRISEEIIHSIRIHLAIYKIIPKKRTLCFITSFNKRDHCISRKSVVVICKMIVDNISEITTYNCCGVFLMCVFFTLDGIIFEWEEFFAGV